MQQPANGVFPDPDSVKEELILSLTNSRQSSCQLDSRSGSGSSPLNLQAVRDLLEQKKYNVQDFYKTAARLVHRGTQSDLACVFQSHAGFV